MNFGLVFLILKRNFAVANPALCHVGVESSSGAESSGAESSRGADKPTLPAVVPSDQTQAMIQQSTIEFLTKHLVDGILPSVTGTSLQEDDLKPVKLKEARLCGFFEDATYLSNSRYILMSDSGVVWVYNGRWYEKAESRSFLKTLFKGVLKRLMIGQVYQVYSAKKIQDECLDAMENGIGGRFRPNRRWIVFDNGVFDVKTGKLDEGFGTQYQSDLVMGIPYDPNKRHALWERKLVEIIPDEGMRNALQMFCGMLIGNRDENKFEYACFIQGPGSNGKSVIASTIANVFGSEHFGKFEPRQLLKASNSEYAMAALDGMIANFTDDLSKDDVSGGMFKKFVSGEEFPARHPYGHMFFKVKAPMMLCCCNEMPKTTDDSWGYHRRILPIVSTERIWGDDDKEKDSGLTAKLSTADARMAVFNWIYEGYRKVVANKGNIPLDASVVEKQLELRDDSNSARRWMRDVGLVKIDSTSAGAQWKYLSDWHKEYREYCEEMGDRTPQTAKSLAKLFREKGFECRRVKGPWQFCIGKREDMEEDIQEDPYLGSVSVLSEAELPF